MKKIILCLGLFSFTVLTSCEKKTERTVETTEHTTVVKDTVTVKEEVPKKDDGTSVKVSNDGVNVDSKDVDVEIKK